MIGNIKGFVGEVSAEMKKVSWPTNEQLKESTNVVIVVTLAITLVVFLMDTVVSKIMKAIF